MNEYDESCKPEKAAYDRLQSHGSRHGRHKYFDIIMQQSRTVIEGNENAG